MPVSRLNWGLEISTVTPVQNGEGNVLCAAHPSALFWNISGELKAWSQPAGVNGISSVPAGLLSSGRAAKKILSSGFFCMFGFS